MVDFGIAKKAQSQVFLTNIHFRLNEFHILRPSSNHINPLHLLCLYMQIALICLCVCECVIVLMRMCPFLVYPLLHISGAFSILLSFSIRMPIFILVDSPESAWWKRFIMKSIKVYRFLVYEQYYDSHNDNTNKTTQALRSTYYVSFFCQSWFSLDYF